MSVSQDTSNATAWLTATLVVISVVFICLTVPQAVLEQFPLGISKAWAHQSSPFQVTNIRRWRAYFAKRMLSAVFNLLAMTNHGISFWLYFMTGKKFRDRAKELLCKKCRRENPT